MKILLTGGTGFIGRELGILLTKQGHEINCLSRNPDIDAHSNAYPAQYFYWEGEKSLPPENALKNSDAIIHLAGENIVSKRWTKNYKKKLIDSRVESTKNIFKALNQYQIKPSVFISASAVGFYGDRADTLLDENSPKGQGFLADLCDKWENSSNQCESLHIRRCILRFGLVISALGGILDESVQLSHRGGLSQLGLLGTQWMSWIELNDLCRFILWCIENPNASGTYNAVSHSPIQNKDFVKIINKTLKNFSLPAVPAFFLKIVVGEKSILLLSSQKVAPSRAIQEGFCIQNNNFEEIIKNTFPNWMSGEYLFQTKLWLSASELSSQQNTFTTYKIKLYPLSLDGTAQISPHCQGSLIHNKVMLKLPFGLLGRIIAFKWFLNKLKNMFHDRKTYLNLFKETQIK